MSGNPVSPDFGIVTKADAMASLGIPPAKQVLSILGGSQGAEAVNRHIAHRIEWYVQLGNTEIIWQCGERNLGRYSAGTTKYPNIRLRGFIEEMPQVYAASDLVVSRAGALTLAELAVTGCPAILIPLPTAAANHQYYNAKTHAAEGAAVVIEQEALDSGILEEHISNILESVPLREQMTQKSLSQAQPDALARIVTSIYELGSSEGHVSQV